MQQQLATIQEAIDTFTHLIALAPLAALAIAVLGVIAAAAVTFRIATATTRR